MKTQFGTYVCLGKSTTHKLTAFEWGISQGYWPHWDFHEGVFSKEDWTQEPDISLEDLYFQRARYIREKYDYVILSYSGGVDSQNIADAFLRQGLRIDELINRSAQISHDDSNHSLGPENVANESRRSAWPLYQRLLQYQPDLKFTYWDWTKDILNSWQTPQDISKVNTLRVNTMAKKHLIDQCHIPNGARAVVLYGIDKPFVFHKNDRFCFVFLDELLHSQGVTFLNYDRPDVDLDLFYWSPDSARMLIKQGHLIKKWFKSHPDHMSLLSFPKRKNRNLYNKIINSIIYPWHDETIWQTLKSGARWFTPEEQWFIKHADHNATKNWKKSIEEFSHAVDNIWQQTQLERPFRENDFALLPGCYSKIYDLGA